MSISEMSEEKRLNKIASDSLYTTQCNTSTIEYSFKVFSRFLLTGNILELGPAEGLMTKHLYHFSDDLTLVDGSDIFCKDLLDRFPRATVHCSLFEDFNPPEKYSNIILGHVLEHVIDPIQILQLVRTWLKPDGLIFAAVPNSQSIHRQAAVIMGILESCKSTSELDKHHGHRRIYDLETFQKDFEQAGLKILHSGGYWLKPVSNAQIHESWNERMLDAFMELGETHPEIAAEIFVIAQK